MIDSKKQINQFTQYNEVLDEHIRKFQDGGVFKRLPTRKKKIKDLKRIKTNLLKMLNEVSLHLFSFYLSISESGTVKFEKHQAIMLTKSSNIPTSKLNLNSI